MTLANQHSVLPLTAGAGDDGRLQIGGCAVADVIGTAGTPAMLLDEQGLRERAREYVAALRSRHPRSEVVYASKALPVPAVIGLLGDEGLGCDVASAGELALALAGGADPARLIVHGNAKRDEDLRQALAARAGLIVVDSFDEIDRLERLLTPGAPEQSVLIRVIPGVRAHDNAAIATGGHGSKFGVPLAQVPSLAGRIRSVPGLSLEGLHAHIGSQLHDLAPLVETVRALAGLERFETYDLGGGLGVPFHPTAPAPPTVDAYAQCLTEAVHEHLGGDVRLIVEPGRSLVAQNVVTVYRVVAVKRGGARTVVAVDGGMGDNPLPRYGDGPWDPFVLDADRPDEACDLVGHHCESGDRIAAGVALAEPQVGDLVVVPVTGAYAAALASNYNGTLRPPLLFCRDGEADEVTRRETIEDLLARHRVRP